MDQAMYAMQPAAMLSPGRSIEQYVSSVGAIPVLDADEEKQLALRLQSEDDLEAARQLVMSNLRFVVYIARSYSGYGLNQADLIQEGNVGLMKAVKRFDPDKGVRLVSFAVHWIKAEIHEFILKNWRIVKVATTKAQRKLFFNLRSSKKRLSWLTEDEVHSIADDLNVEPATVRQMEGRMSGADVAFDAPDDDDSDTAFAAPSNFLGTHADESPELTAVAEQQQNLQQGALHDALGTLDERALAIISRRFLSEDKATLHDLAAEFGVSAERIRQLEKNALKKLNAAMVSAQPVAFEDRQFIA